LDAGGESLLRTVQNQPIMKCVRGSTIDASSPFKAIS
jgi:hypothetical protein